METLPPVDIRVYQERRKKSARRASRDRAVMIAGSVIMAAGFGLGLRDREVHQDLAVEKFPIVVYDHEKHFFDSGVIWYGGKVVGIDTVTDEQVLKIDLARAYELGEYDQAYPIAERETWRRINKNFFEESLDHRPMQIADATLPVSRFDFKLGMYIGGLLVTATGYLSKKLSEVPQRLPQRPNRSYFRTV